MEGGDRGGGREGRQETEEGTEQEDEKQKPEKKQGLGWASTNTRETRGSREGGEKEQQETTETGRGAEESEPWKSDTLDDFSEDLKNPQNAKQTNRKTH